ncbi:MAG: YIP1 family protein [Candidatus Korarchaeota archaeon]|nr:YIP1 family protein [Candidatus Korarchaeota archaeon]
MAADWLSLEIREVDRAEGIGLIEYLLSPVKDPWSVFRKETRRPSLRLFLLAALIVSALGAAGGVIVVSRTEYRFVNLPEGVDPAQTQAAMRVFSRPAFVGATSFVSGMVVALLAGGLAYVVARLAGGEPVNLSTTLTCFEAAYLTEGVKALIDVVGLLQTLPEKIVIATDLANPYSARASDVAKQFQATPVSLSMSGLVAVWQWFLLTELMRTLFGLGRGKSAAAAILVLLKSIPLFAGLAPW